MLLKQKGVYPNKPDMSGQTPPFLAAEHGCEGVVQMLLRWEVVSPDKPPNADGTPLSCAAWNGHGGVVEILLRGEEVNLDRPDNAGRTLLSFAPSMPLRRLSGWTSKSDSATTVSQSGSPRHNSEPKGYSFVEIEIAGTVPFSGHVTQDCSPWALPSVG